MRNCGKVIISVSVDGGGGVDGGVLYFLPSYLIRKTFFLLGSIKYHSGSSVGDSRSVLKIS